MIELVDILAEESHRQVCLALVGALSCIGWMEILSQSHLPLEKWQRIPVVCHRLAASYLIRNTHYCFSYPAPGAGQCL